MPSGQTDQLMRVKGDESKPFTMTGSTVAQRIIQSATGAMPEGPRKVIYDEKKIAITSNLINLHL